MLWQLICTAQPDKHKESARFMQPLLGEIVSSIKTNAPPVPASCSQTLPELPTTSTKTPAEQKLEKELSDKPSSVPSASTQDAVDKWLKKHQSQFRRHLRSTWLKSARFLYPGKLSARILSTQP